MDSQPKLLAHAVLTKANEVPDSPWLLYSKSPKWQKENGYDRITWKQFACSISKAAFWLDENIPRKTTGRQTFAYQGPNDARYYILIVAAATSKRTIFIPDGRITQEGLSEILMEIKCTAWISSQEKRSSVEGQECYLLPSLQELLSQDDNEFTQYPYDETWDQAKDDTVCIIHTSGTTGVPKPIYLRNGFMSALDWAPTLSRYRSRKVTCRHMVNSVALTACAPQWAAGFAFSLCAAAFVGLTTVILPSEMTFPIDPSSLSQICKYTGAEGLITPPSLIEEFHKDSAGLEFLKSLKYVTWVGAGLNQSVGDALEPYTHLIPIIGSTERGVQLSFEPEDRGLWNSFEFIPESGPRFDKVGDNLFELYIERSPESCSSQGIFYTFPNVTALSTAEIYSLVLDKDGSRRWVFQGRKDDLVKLSWLAKFHATHIEDALAKHDKVKAAVVGGEGRDVPYVIIEPKDQKTVGNPERFIDEIYDRVIRSINQTDDDEIQIPREMVMLADATIAFKRTLKMTIMRKEVEKAYQSRIDNLYKNWEDKGIKG